MKAMLQIAVLLFGLVFPPQGNVVRIFSRTPGGIAPTLTMFGNCTSGGLSCAVGVQNVTAGDSYFALMVSTAGGTQTVSNGVDTLTQDTPHTVGNNVTSLWYKLGSAGGSTVTTTCSTTSATFWIVCLIWSVHCAATCVIEAGPTYADTSATGSSGTATAGTITTAHQLNELVLGLFTVENANAGLFAALGGYTIPGTAGCQSTAGCGQAQVSNSASAALELLDTSSVGSQTATITEPTLRYGW